MSKESSGIKKNITNLQTVIAFLESLGIDWNPVNPALKLPQLNLRHAAAEKVYDEFDIIDALDRQRTAERKSAYEPLNDLVRRVVHAANTCKMEAPSIVRIKTLKDLIAGTNKNDAADKREKKAKKLQKLLPENTPTPELPDAHSVLQLAYDVRYDNFAKLITTLETTEKYLTNEADLSLSALKAYLLFLKTANEATRVADKAWQLKVAERNKIITDEVDSIYSDVIEIKTQLKSMKAVSTEQYKEVSKLRFATT